MVLTVSFALSLVIGLFVTIPAVMRQHHRPVDISVEISGPHDFTVRRTALSSAALPASTASRPASVTIASRPSVGQDGRVRKGDLPDGKSGKFFAEGLDKGQSEHKLICPSGKTFRIIR
jgi:hypothetical protein